MEESGADYWRISGLLFSARGQRARPLGPLGSAGVGEVVRTGACDLVFGSGVLDSFCSCLVYPTHTMRPYAMVKYPG